ncbi:MAG: glycoside hydrolase family 38 C-terminal domain-containing protein [Deinococcota bacterium]
MLSIPQRLKRLETRLDELTYWLRRDSLNLAQWTCNGEPLALGSAWPLPPAEQRNFAEDDQLWHLAHPAVSVPQHWSVAETRLELDLGGESLLFIDYLQDATPQDLTLTNQDVTPTEARATSHTVPLGHDPHHRRYVLSGRHFALRAQSVARWQFGVPNRTPHLAQARLVRWEQELEHFHRLLVLVAETVHELAEHEVAPYLLDAAEQALGQVPWPSHSHAYLKRTFDSPSLRAIWNRPQLTDDGNLEPTTNLDNTIDLTRSDLALHNESDLPEFAGLEHTKTFLERYAPSEQSALTDDSRQAVYEAHRWLQTRLQHLQTHYPAQGHIALSGHAHIDLVWLWPLEETVRKTQRTFATALHLLERYPEATFNQSSGQLYALVEAADPELFARVLNAMDAGDQAAPEPPRQDPTAHPNPRWEGVGGMWVEPDANMPCGESFVRQLLYGQRYFYSRTGRYHDVCWLPDTFGFTPGLPQLLQAAGIANFFTMKVNWSESNSFPHDLFWWEGLDGSRVLAHTFNNPVGGYNGELGPKATLATWRNYRGKYHVPQSLLTIGFGDGGGGLTEEMLERYRAMQVFPVLPKLSFTTVSDYFARARSNLVTSAQKANSDSPRSHAAKSSAASFHSQRPLPVWNGDIYLELHRATTISQARTKRLHRQAEHSLVSCEALGSFITLLDSRADLSTMTAASNFCDPLADPLNQQIGQYEGQHATSQTPSVTSSETATTVVAAPSPSASSNASPGASSSALAAEVTPVLADLPTGTSMAACWHMLLRNQFHDILPGSSIAEAYQRTERELSQVICAAQTRIQQVHLNLAQHLVRPGKQAALLVMNPTTSTRPLRLTLAAPYHDSQATAHGQVLTRPHNLMSFSSNIILRGNAPAPVWVDAGFLENDYLHVDLAEDGSIARIVDRLRGRDVLAGRGNQLWAYVDKPRQWDAWDVDADYLLEGQEITDVQNIEVIEEGPHRVAVAVTRAFRNSTIRQEIRLWSNSARLEFYTELDWHDRRWLLKAHFPVNVRAPYANFETAFGVIARPTHRNTSWQTAQFEVPAQRFVDLSEATYGVALLNDGRYGHHVQGNDMGLSLVRAPTYPDPLADEGRHSFTYALYPHEGTWFDGGVLREAEDLNMPLYGQPIQADFETSLQLIELKGLPVALAALKPLEDGGGLVLRCYEPRGARGQVRLSLPGGWRATHELDLLERPISPIRETSFDFTPFQVRSWKLAQEA